MKFRRSLVIPALLAVCAGAIYLPRLEDAPPYLTPDELFSGLSAQSIAATGHDLNGRVMPLYFQLTPHFVTRMWYQPIVIYAIALVLKILPFTEGTIRLPMALAAIADVVLMYYIARIVFRSEWYGIAAAALLAITPAHFINIRVAMDHYAYLPFLLGWLLCVLLYVENNRPVFLFGAGLLLGLGLYTYIASYLLMPAYAMATILLLYSRKEPAGRYALLAAGFLIPAIVCVPYLLTHPVIRDTLWRYDRRELPTAGTSTIARNLFDIDRLKTAASVYITFANPRFLFVDGPRSRWPIGAFLLPVAGLSLTAFLRGIRRPDTMTLLLWAGVLTAPIVATAVGEPEEIRRAGAMLPAVALLAIAGVQYAGSADRESARRVAWVLMWTTIIVVAVAYRDQLARGQAIVRAATVPLAITGLGVLLGRRGADADATRSAMSRTLGVAGVLVAVHAVYVASNKSTPVGIVILGAISLATLLPASATRVDWTAASAALLALLSAHFLFIYVDYSQLHRIGVIPASVVILGARLLVSASTTAFAFLALRGATRLASHSSDRRLAVAAAAGVLAAQLGYFWIDAFTDYRLRALHAAAVLGIVVSAAALLRQAGARLDAGRIVTAGLIGVAAIQFTIFYADYFTDYRRRGSGDRDGNERIAFEAVLDRARSVDIPAVYLGWPSALDPLYWRFYALKHHREDLLPRTIPALDFDVERIRALPADSVVITRPSRQVDLAIDAMVAERRVAQRDLLTTPDGTRAFWILRMAGAANGF